MDTSVRSTIWDVSLEEYEYEYEIKNNNDAIEFINDIYEDDWERGDCVCILERSGYRNEGKFFWDGEKAISMGYDWYDYGHVPFNFVVGKEFHALYWENVIEYNYIVYTDLSEAKIVNTFEMSGIYNTILNTSNGETWVIFGDNIKSTKGVFEFLHPESSNYNYALNFSKNMNIPLERMLLNIN